MTPCRHCQRRRPNRPRNLCWGCYYAPGVRDLYPITSVFGSEVRDYCGASPQPAEATDAVQGSEEKIRILEQRALAGESLFGAKDRRFNWRREKPTDEAIKARKEGPE